MQVPSFASEILCCNLACCCPTTLGQETLFSPSDQKFLGFELTSLISSQLKTI